MTDAQPPTAPPEPWEAADAAVDRAIRDVARATNGPAAIESVPSWAGSKWNREQVKPLAAIDALVTLRLAVTAQTGRFARLARERGHTWDDIGIALGTAADKDNYRSRAEVAFEAIVPKPQQQFDERTTYYRCSACDSLIVDLLPIGAPHENERGHDPNCTRRRADIAAHEAGHADE